MGVGLFRGHIAGIPVGGGLAQINSSDISALADVSGRFIRGVTHAGKVGLGILFFGFLLDALSERKDPRLPLNGFVTVNGGGGHFIGVLTTDKIDFLVGRDKLSVPIERIVQIDNVSIMSIWPPYSRQPSRIKLIDGSAYTGSMRSNLELLSVAGTHHIDADDYCQMIGAETSDIQSLRLAIVNAIQHTREEAIKLLGEDIYEQFFIT